MKIKLLKIRHLRKLNTLKNQLYSRGGWGYNNFIPDANPSAMVILLTQINVVSIQYYHLMSSNALSQ